MGNQKAIRVILGNAPDSVRQGVRAALHEQPDIDIVAEILDPIGILMAPREIEVEVVVVESAEGDELGLSSHLLAEYPDLIVISALRSGDQLCIEQRLPRRDLIEEPWTEHLLECLQRAISLSRIANRDAT